MAKENNRVHELHLIIAMGASDEAWHYENEQIEQRGDCCQLGLIMKIEDLN